MVHTPIKPADSPSERKVSKLEGIKERSQFLREPVATELTQDTTHFTEEGNPNPEVSRFLSAGQPR